MSGLIARKLFPILNKYLLYFHTTLRALYRMLYDPTEALQRAAEETIRFNNRACKPPLPQREARKIISSKRPDREPRSSTIYEQLAVTLEECEQLNLVTLIPERDSRIRATRKRRAALNRKRKADLVDQAIRAGMTPTRIQAELQQIHGLAVSYQFISYRRRRSEK